MSDKKYDEIYNDDSIAKLLGLDNEKMSNPSADEHMKNVLPSEYTDEAYRKKYGDDVDVEKAKEMENDKNYTSAIVKTSKFEGGYYKSSKDPGKETKYGITKKWYPNEDIKNLTPERAKWILYRDYYKKPNIYKLPDVVRDQVFDNATNMGQPTAIKTLQKTVGAKDDGILGPNTLQKVNSFFETNSKNKYKKKIKEEYDAVCKANPVNCEEHYNGWMNRLDASFN